MPILSEHLDQSADNPSDQTALINLKVSRDWLSSISKTGEILNDTLKDLLELKKLKVSKFSDIKSAIEINNIDEAIGICLGIRKEGADILHTNIKCLKLGIAPPIPENFYLRLKSLVDWIDNATPDPFPEDKSSLNKYESNFIQIQDFESITDIFNLSERYQILREATHCIEKHFNAFLEKYNKLQIELLLPFLAHDTYLNSSDEIEVPNNVYDVTGSKNTILDYLYHVRMHGTSEVEPQSKNSLLISMIYINENEDLIKSAVIYLFGKKEFENYVKQVSSLNFIPQVFNESDESKALWQKACSLALLLDEVEKHPLSLFTKGLNTLGNLSEELKNVYHNSFDEFLEVKSTKIPQALNLSLAIIWSLSAFETLKIVVGTFPEGGITYNGTEKDNNLTFLELSNSEKQEYLLSCAPAFTVSLKYINKLIENFHEFKLGEPCKTENGEMYFIDDRLYAQVSCVINIIGKYYSELEDLNKDINNFLFSYNIDIEDDIPIYLHSKFYLRISSQNNKNTWRIFNNLDEREE